MKKDWTEVELGEIFQTITGNTPPKNESYNYGNYIPFIKPPELNNKVISDANDFLSIEGSKIGRVLSKDSVLISCIGNLGKVGISTENIAFNQQINAIVPLKGVIPKFTFYQCLSPFFQKNLEQLSSATTVTIVNKRKFNSIKYWLAPLPEQRAIVAKLEQLFSKLDNSINNLKSAKNKLEIYRQAVLKKAFEGKLITSESTKEDEPYNTQKPAEPQVNYDLKSDINKLPEGWNIVEINNLGKIVTGNTPSKKNTTYYRTKDFPFYKPTDLDLGNNVNKSIDYLSKDGIKVGRIVPENSILVTCIGATIGKTGLVKKLGAFNQQLNAIIPNDNSDPKFIYYQAIGVDFQNQIKNKSSSTTLPILNKKKFSELPMKICSYKIQKEIVKEIESRFSVCDKLEESIDQSLEKAEALRQSILKKAFEGELLSDEEIEDCKKEPDWEPAEKLLERIKKEK